MRTIHKMSVFKATIAYGSAFQPIITSDDEDHGERSANLKHHTSLALAGQGRLHFD